MIKRDATMLLRPKTGLKDMVIEMDPGTQTLPAVDEGYTIPVAQTEPDVNLDEILASLDRDTRDYLRLLVAGGGEGLKDNGAQLRERVPPLRAAQPRRREAHRASCSKRRKNLGAADPQPPAAGHRGRHEGQGAGGAGRVPERRLRGVREPGREPARVPACCCPTRCRRPTRRCRSRPKLTDQLGPDAARSCARARGRSHRRPARAAAVRAPDDPADPRTRSGRSRAGAAADGRGAEARRCSDFEQGRRPSWRRPSTS